MPISVRKSPPTPARAPHGKNGSKIHLTVDRAGLPIDAPSYGRLRLTGVSFGSTRPTELGVVIASAGERLLPAVADGRVRP